MYALNKHNFDSYADFKKTAAPDILKAAHTRQTGRYGLIVPKGKMSKDEYLEKVYALNKEKINEAYSSFSGKQVGKEYSETAFKRFKQEYNLREQYIYGKARRNLANRSEILNALQRSDFFNTTEQRQRYSLLEQMKITKTGKRRNMLKDFMRDTGYYSVEQMVNNQNLKHYYDAIKRAEDESTEDWTKNKSISYYFVGMDGSLWQVTLENSPTEIYYRKIGDSEI